MKKTASLLIVGLFAVGVLNARSGNPGADRSASVSAGSSASSVVGRVKFEGPAPAATRVNMAADPTCAKAHPGSLLTDDFVIGDGGSLSNVVVFVSDGLGNQTFDMPSQPVKIEQKGCMYQPHVVAVRANQKIEVVNDDHTLHNIHPLPANNREWNKAEPEGMTFEESFAREEVAIPVKCNVHPWMHSYIAVFKHPYFAVTGKDGSFDLRNLPPGEYTIEAWHEKLGKMTQKITVAPGEAKKLEFVFKGGQNLAAR